MKHFPLLMIFKNRSGDTGSRSVNLWLPLFLIIPLVLLILLALFLLILPLLLVYTLVTFNTRWWHYLRHGAPAVFQTVRALPGLKVDVEDKEETVYIDVNY